MNQGGVVDQNVEPAEMLFGLSNQVAAVVLLAHIAEYKNGLAPGFPNCGGDGLAALAVSAVHHDPRAARGEHPGDPGADALCGAGDDGYLAFEFLRELIGVIRHFRTQSLRGEVD